MRLIEMKYILFCLMLMPFGLNGQSLYAKYDALLKEHVSPAGVVDYKGLKAKEKDLKSVLMSLSKVNPKVLSKDDQMAFYINYYNAQTLALVLENYPLTSIMKLDKGKVWDRKVLVIEGVKYSLNNIEHDILRKNYKDPRIHFALNCAAISCPPLHNKAFIGLKLNEQLNLLTTQFINNKVYNTIGQNGVKVSKIFDWYQKDFGGLNAFLKKYSKVVISDKAGVEFLDYDWSLNGK
jgi:hypothetical protein